MPQPVAVSVESSSLFNRHDRIEVERWPTEKPLLLVAAGVSAVIWLIAMLSIVGAVYALFLGGFFFIMHVAFVAHVRGSGVRLGPDQFPELHARVTQIAVRMGMEKVPATYLMQAGGSLNAFATRFLGSHIVVLFSDLLEACGDNTAARDMIIAHELGHIHAGHLRWHWFLLPANLIPFLGSTLSRAREYTCDRYGLAGAGDLDGAVLGLTVLAAGGKHAPKVNRSALVSQRAELNTGWMRIGEWFSTHPPLARRICEMDPALGNPRDVSLAGTLRAFFIIGVLLLPMAVAIWIGVKKVPGWLDEMNQGAALSTSAHVGPDPEWAAEQVQRGFTELAAFLADEQAAGRPLPVSAGALFERWAAERPDEELPRDPYDGFELGYTPEGASYFLWSSGPDQEPRTADDLVYRPE